MLPRVAELYTAVYGFPFSGAVRFGWKEKQWHFQKNCTG